MKEEQREPEILSNIQGYIDEHEYILANERVKKSDKEKYSYLIITLESIKKDYQETNSKLNAL